jgi:hypothetical protein
LHNSAALGSERVHGQLIIFPSLIAYSINSARSERKKLMIGKATVFAIAMLAPGFAFAADSAATGAAPAVTAHENADASATVKTDSKTDSVKSGVKADTNVKANAEVKKVKVVKTARTTAHKAKTTPAADKAAPAADKKTDSKS